MTTTSNETKIREIAYALWEQEGRPNGRDLEHYFKAAQFTDPMPAADVEKPKSKAGASRARKPASTTTRKPSARKSVAKS